MVNTAPAGSRPLVTLFVTGWNQAATIGPAIDSAFAQTWAPLEIILSDDASTDDTGDLMEAAAAAYRGPHQVRVLRAPENGGIVGNVNRVMEAARGELIVMAGGDDVSRSDRVARLTEAWLATDRRSHLLHSSARTIDAEGQVVGMRPAKPPLLADPSPRGVLEGDLAVLGATAAWSRALFERFGPIPAEAVVEDLVLTFRGILAGPLAYVDEPLIDWRVGGVSWTTRGMLAHPFGIRARYVRWWAGLHRVALACLERHDCPEREVCRAIAQQKLERYDFESALHEAKPSRRFTLLVKGLGLSLHHRRAFFAKLALIHLLRPAYRLYWETRYASTYTGMEASR